MKVPGLGTAQATSGPEALHRARTEQWSLVSQSVLAVEELVRGNMEGAFHIHFLGWNPEYGVGNQNSADSFGCRISRYKVGFQHLLCTITRSGQTHFFPGSIEEKGQRYVQTAVGLFVNSCLPFCLVPSISL